MPLEFASPQSFYKILTDPAKHDYGYWNSACRGELHHFPIRDIHFWVNLALISPF